MRHAASGFAYPTQSAGMCQLLPGGGSTFDSTFFVLITSTKERGT